MIKGYSAEKYEGLIHNRSLGVGSGGRSHLLPVAVFTTSKIFSKFVPGLWLKHRAGWDTEIRQILPSLKGLQSSGAGLRELSVV